jgi:plastocyanin
MLHKLSGLIPIPGMTLPSRRAACLGLIAAVLLVPVAMAQVGRPTPPPIGLAGVTIKSDGLHPQSVTIKVGEAVIWINKDSKPHAIRGGRTDGHSVFVTSPIAPGSDSGLFAFNEPGTIQYTVTDHSDWTGTIIVRP